MAEVAVPVHPRWAGTEARAFHFCIPPRPSGVSVCPSFRLVAALLSGIDRNVSAGEPPSGAVGFMRAAAPTCQDIPLADRGDVPRRTRPPSPLSPLGPPPRVHPPGHIALCLAASFCGCAGAAQPVAVSPKPLVASELRRPPWQAGSPPAGGHEAAAPAQPPILTRRVTLALGTRVTLVRGSTLRPRAKLAAAAGGDIEPQGGAVVVDAAGQFVTPRMLDAHSHLGVYPTPGAVAHLDGSEREPDTSPVVPQAQSADAFWPQDPGIERAVAGGVTTIQVLSGSGNLIRGCAVTMELRPVSQPHARHRGARRAESG